MAGMDIAQKEWLAIVPYLLSLRYSRFPPRPVHAFRRWCYDVAQSDVFENVILFLVVCNVVETCIWWRGMDPQLLLIKERVNLFMAICFGVRNPCLYIATCPHTATSCSGSFWPGQDNITVIVATIEYRQQRFAMLHRSSS